MSVAVTVMSEVSDCSIPYADWPTWRAAQAPGVTLFLDERRGHPCTHCQGARQAFYRTPTGWQPLPCSTCWGSGEAPYEVVVRLVERRAVPR